MELSYRKASSDDLPVITDFSFLLSRRDGLYERHEHTYEELYEENIKLLAKEDFQRIFLAFDGQKAIGFVHCSLRFDYVDGTHGGTIGYLEGIYILPEYRKNGIARELVNMGKIWAKENKAEEFASDCELPNTESERFHKKIGFEEANRLICFIQKL